MIYGILALCGTSVTLVVLLLHYRARMATREAEAESLRSRLAATAKEVDALRSRFAPVVDLDSEKERISGTIQQLRTEQRQVIEEAAREKTELSQKYASALATYEQLRKEIAVLEDSLEDISFGLYQPHFDFQTSEEFKSGIEAVRLRQREIIREGMAAVCDERWTVGGSAREGQRMAKQYMKLVLRAFNAECDAAIANVSWNNVVKMEERIRKSFEALNALGTVMKVRVTEAYMRARLDELRLTYEHEEKRHQEREEQRRIREQIREEERAQRELAKAQEEAAKEEDRFEKALDRARTEAATASGAELDKLSARITTLEAELKRAQEQKQRAQSMAELTKSGYVYVISNVGSFGSDVFKVGMTRRLEPMERVQELGDASVPFPFDVHAMLYSDNAPELESALHAHLREGSLNMVNPRKEFFKADLRDIEEFAKARGVQVEFTQVAEAREFRESVAMRQASQAKPEEGAVSFPVDLFGAVADAASDEVHAEAQ